MSSRETVGVDIDDVVAAHVPSVIQYSNENFGTSLTPDTYNPDWFSMWAELKYEEIMARAEEFHKATVANYERIADSDTVLRKLSAKYKLVVITARQRYNVEPTHAWLAQHFEGIFEETHFVPIWEPGNKVTKADICKDIGADYLIDDLPRHCNLAAEGGIKALLFGDYPWCRDHSVNKDVVRVKNWREVGEYFNV